MKRTENTDSKSSGLRKWINLHYLQINQGIDLFLIFGMSLYTVSLILQSSVCGYHLGVCFQQLNPRNWDIFNHSLSYDLFQLRANSNFQVTGEVGSHWSSSLMIGVLFFATMFILKNVKIAFVNAGFVTFYHEEIWHVFVVEHNGGLNFNPFLGLTLNNEFLLIIVVNVIIFYIFRKIFYRWELLLLTIPYVLLLAYWWIYDNMAVTVFGNFPTATFNQPLNNELETCSWFLVTLILIVNTVIINRKKIDIWLK